jgi:hypothetical protein
VNATLLEDLGPYADTWPDAYGYRPSRRLIARVERLLRLEDIATALPQAAGSPLDDHWEGLFGHGPHNQSLSRDGDFVEYAADVEGDVGAFLLCRGDRALVYGSFSTCFDGWFQAGNSLLSAAEMARLRERCAQAPDEDRGIGGPRPG